MKKKIPIIKKNYLKALDELSNGYVVPEGSIGKQLKQLQKNESKKDVIYNNS